MSKAPGATPDQKKASSPEASAWVSANAGSGKTHVLVDRVIRLMLEGADPSTILCLTYTKAAATEMANRLHERLGEWIGLDDQALSLRLASIGCDRIDARIRDRARRLFTAALETPGGFKIQTIHAFLGCSSYKIDHARTSHRHGRPRLHAARPGFAATDPI